MMTRRTGMHRVLALFPRQNILMKATRSISSPQPLLQQGDKRARLESPHPSKRNKKKKKIPVESGSSEDVISREVVALLGKELVEKAEADGSEWESPFGFREEVELTVSGISSSGMSYSKVTLAAQLPSRSISDLVRSGEGLALSPSSKAPWVVVVPFVLPGEVIRARVHRQAKMYSFADLISVEVPNTELRDMSRVKCKYFGTCAGCQYQVRRLLKVSSSAYTVPLDVVIRDAA